MKLLKIKRDAVELEIGMSEIGILHYALYDYLAKVEAKLKIKKLDICQTENYKALRGTLEQMAETVSTLI
jgi:hypothetical protein